MAEPEVGVNDDTAQQLCGGLWIGLARAKSNRTGTTSLGARRLAWHQEEVNTETAERRPRLPLSSPARLSEWIEDGQRKGDAECDE
jgi:hypothetical protein